MNQNIRITMNGLNERCDAKGAKPALFFLYRLDSAFTKD